MTPDSWQPPVDAGTLLTHLDTTGVSHLTAMLAVTRTLLDAWSHTLVQVRQTPAPPPAPRPPPPAATDAPPLPSTGATDWPVSVQMLDGFQIWVGSRQVATDLPHGKARALLMLLLLERRRPMSRSRLCGLLWPDADPAAARNSLNVHLHRVRHSLTDPDLLRHCADGYQILPRGPVWIDVEQFEQYASQAERADTAGQAAQAITHYEIAAALYRTHLVDDGTAEPALAPHAQHLRDRLNLVLDRLSCLREARGDLHGCLRTTLRHLTLDECNETAHRRLMRCYGRLDQPQLAERQYRQCVSALRRQLDQPPSADTTALYRRITRRETL
jgi:DNA-binding SARP family transcriptional activator